MHKFFKTVFAIQVGALLATAATLPAQNEADEIVEAAHLEVLRVNARADGRARKANREIDTMTIKWQFAEYQKDILLVAMKAVLEKGVDVRDEEGNCLTMVGWEMQWGPCLPKD